MGELAIRRNSQAPVPKYVAAKTEKAETAGSTTKTAASTPDKGVAFSKTLERLLASPGQTTAQVKEALRTLQAGGAVLDEVQDALSRLEELAKQVADGGESSGEARSEWEKLAGEIDRMIRSAVSGNTPLFSDGDSLGSDVEALLRAALQNGGASVDGSGQAAASTPGQSLVSLQQFLQSVQAKMNEGMSADEAVESLTNGAYTTFAEFASQIGDGLWMQDFLVDILSSASFDASLMALLSGLGSMEMSSLMDLLTNLSASAMPQPDISGTAADNAASADASAAAASGQPAAGPAAAAGAEAASSGGQAMQVGNLEIRGDDLSGVTVNQETGEVTVSGGANVVIQGSGEESAPSIRLAGSGTVTLQDTNPVSVTVEDGAEAHLVAQGETRLGELVMNRGAALSLGGESVKVGAFRGDASNTLHLTGGAVTVEGKDGAYGTVNASVVMHGPAAFAAHAQNVLNPAGEAMRPLDNLWKTLIPNWNHISSMEIDGKQVKMSLDRQDPALVWLAKADGSQGSPIHQIVIHGRDEAGRPKSRYAYLHWNHETGEYEEVDMYPNPFTVTGGLEGRDWMYDSESHLLAIFTSEVTGLSGGAGMDARNEPFSGKVALADNIGEMELTLSGVICETDFGWALRLGRGNQVTLLLEGGSENRFESGEACAGISLGEGTTLQIDCPDARGAGHSPAGTLTAHGGEGGAGIGRDSGAGRDRTSRIQIRGGNVNATGAGGGAGIGSGKRGFMGAISILGGTVQSTGGNAGGAGIGGALDAPVGDIHIQGGRITAVAVCQAAAIGAGVQGACGDILISGTTKILKAVGGNPGADIGACLFGGCGKVQVTGGADIGAAKLWTQAGAALRMGEDAASLPQFRLSAKTLQLERLSIATREQAREAWKALGADRQLVKRIQDAYGEMYEQVGRKKRKGGLSRVPVFIHGSDDAPPVRDSDAAGSLLADTRQQPSQAAQSHRQSGPDGVQLLL